MRIFKCIFIFMLCFVGCSSYTQSDPMFLAPPPSNTLLLKPRIAIVLSGGGGRAVAHAGVLEVLEKHNIPIDLIVGCSAGSVVGALYADDPNAKNLKQKIISLKKWDLLDPSMLSSVKMFWGLEGPVQGKALREFVKKNVKATAFQQLHIPLAVVTTDVDKGETFIIQSGPLAPALHASSAVPMLFSPVRLYGRTLVDGGVASPVPVEIAKQFSPDLIIAVDIGTSPDYGPVDNAYQLAQRSLHISYYRLSKWQTDQADIVIHPEIDKFGMFDDHANETMYQAGRIAALKALPLIQKALITNKR